MEPRKKQELPVGQKVKGYGLLNEYGEFDFIPENTGSRAGRTKLVKQGENYTISTTNKVIMVHLRLEKKKGIELLQGLMAMWNEIFNVIRNYEF